MRTAPSEDAQLAKAIARQPLDYEAKCFGMASASPKGRREHMPYFERVKDRFSGPFSPTLITERQKAGWQLVSIEWRRELPASETPHESEHAEEIPYGLRLSDDCLRLEIDPYENSVLIQMMDLLSQDFSYSQIVSDLNEKGLRTRTNSPWDRVSLHKMMPRLIEVGPRLFAGDKRKRSLSQ